MLLCFFAHLFLLVVKKVTRVIGRGLFQAAVNEKELWTRPGLEETSGSFFVLLGLLIKPPGRLAERVSLSPDATVWAD
jgi:hypothetical protein